MITSRTARCTSCNCAGAAACLLARKQSPAIFSQRVERVGSSGKQHPAAAPDTRSPRPRGAVASEAFELYRIYPAQQQAGWRCRRFLTVAAGRVAATPSQDQLLRSGSQTWHARRSPNSQGARACPTSIRKPWNSRCISKAAPVATRSSCPGPGKSGVPTAVILPRWHCVPPACKAKCAAPPASAASS
jgi:hypothetical protein